MFLSASRIRCFLIGWAALSLLLCALAAAGALPSPKDRGVLGSPWFLGVAGLSLLSYAAWDWIARFRTGPSPEEAAAMWSQRVAEIGGWLRERVTIEEAQELLACDAGRHAEKVRRAVDEWVRYHSAPSDELWYYDTGGDTWEYLRGERGLAIVRQGTVREFWMYENN